MGGDSSTWMMPILLPAVFSPSRRRFTGIAVAILARGNPLGILIGAVLFGGLATAGATIQLFSDVPIEIVNILQGLIMIFAVADFGLRDWFARRAARHTAAGDAA